MTNPYPLPRETRETAIIFGDGRATYGPLNFRVWDVADVVATVSRGNGSWLAETVVAVKATVAAFEFFSATFAPPLRQGDRAIVQSRRVHERSTDVTRGGTLSGNALELEFSRQATVLQELRRDAGRALAFAPGIEIMKPLQRPEPGCTLIGNSDGTGFAAGPSVTEIGEAKGYTERAEIIAAEVDIIRSATSLVRDETAGLRDQTAVALVATLASEARAAALLAAAEAEGGRPDGSVLDEGFEGPYDGISYNDIDEGYE